MRRTDEAGYTITEVLVAIFLFAIISVGFYQVLFRSVAGGDTANNVARVSEEARHGFNRLVRDTREAKEILEATSTSYTVWIDFDADDVIDAADYEYVRFEFDDDQITLTAMDPGATEDSISDDATLEGPALLINGVQQIASTEVFSYSSNQLQFDTNGDGVASYAELEAGVGAAAALSYVSSVDFAFAIESADGEQITDFYSQAQLRNKRFAE